MFRFLNSNRNDILQSILFLPCFSEVNGVVNIFCLALPQSSIYENDDSRASITPAGHGVAYLNGTKKERSSASTTNGSTDHSDVMLQATKSGPGSNDHYDEMKETDLTPPRSSRTSKKSQSQNN